MQRVLSDEVAIFLFRPTLELLFEPPFGHGRIIVHLALSHSSCNRDLSGPFGSEAYAMEELVAELGAAFLCTELGTIVEPRVNHAQYLTHWLNGLNADKHAIFGSC